MAFQLVVEMFLGDFQQNFGFHVGFRRFRHVLGGFMSVSVGLRCNLECLKDFKERFMSCFRGP